MLLEINLFQTLIECMATGKDNFEFELTLRHHSLIHTKYTLSKFLNFQCIMKKPPVIPPACSWGSELYSASVGQLNCTLKSANEKEVATVNSL